MAEVVDAVPPRKTHYPWAEWLDGRLWRLHSGVDIPASGYVGFAQTAKSAARSRGVQIEIHERGDYVYLQAFPQPTTARPEWAARP